MSLISLKRSSRHKVNMDIGWEISSMMFGIYLSWREWGFGDFVITSAKDGKHREGSFHKQDKNEYYRGQAVDIRTRHLFRKGKYKKEFITWLKWKQKFYGPQGLRFFLHGYHKEKNKKPVPHLHLAYDQKKGKLWRWVK